MNKLIELSANEVERLIDKSVVMIDVRREDEWQYTGLIKNAYKMTFFDMFGNVDIQGWMKKFQELVKSKEQQVVLICAHANRTRTIGEYLMANYGYTNVCHLTGGIALWQREGKTTVPYK